MTDRIIVACFCGFIGWNGLWHTPTPITLHQKMVQRSHAQVCIKKNLRPKIKKLCKRWL